MEFPTQPLFTTASCPVQRWRMGRNFWRHDRDEGFRRGDYAVDGLADGLAKKFVETHHYSHSYPFARERYGLFRGRTLVGVAVLSTPINNSVIPRYSGHAPAEGLDLGRFILLDEVPYNAESFFLGAVLRQVQQDRSDLKALVAYSDPMPRRTSDGSVVMPGHVGIAYQATNGKYVGRAAAKTLHLTREGIALSTRALSKVRLQEHGAGSAEKMLERLGAPKRQRHEESGDWIARVLKSGPFTRVRHPGNHVYTWALGGRSRNAAALGSFSSKPYPKCQDPVQMQLAEVPVLASAQSSDGSSRDHLQEML